MSIFDKMKTNAIIGLAKGMGFDIEEMVPQAVDLVKEFFNKESQKAGANLVGLLTVDTVSNQLQLGLYLALPEGLQFHKEIDISDPKKLLNDLLNGNTDTDTATEAPAVISMAHQPTATEAIERPITTEQHPTASTAATDTNPAADSPTIGIGLSEPNGTGSEAVS